MKFRVEGTAMLVLQAIARLSPPHDLALLPADASSRELAIYGARGDRKTSTLLLGAIFHCQEHERRGFPLPVPWVSVRDNMERHQRTTVRTFEKEWWGGLWKIYDKGKLVVARLGRKEFVRFDLFGLEDEAAMEKLKGEWVGIHFEEVAPSASLVESAGLSEEAWMLALTSQGKKRTPSHHWPAVITTNYPDEDHWSWKRFVEAATTHLGSNRVGDPRWGYAPELRRMYIRIPAGEYADPEERREWVLALGGNPGMYRRLVAGEPGSIQLGQPVTPEYQEERHRSLTDLPVAPGPLFLGWDLWHHPAIALASLTPLGQLRFHLGRRLDNADVGALIEEIVKPWLGKMNLANRPRIHTADPSGEGGDQSDRAMSAVRLILKKLPGQYRRVSNDPEQRERAIKERLRYNLSTGEPSLLVCGPEGKELHDALRGGWHKKRNGKVEKDGERGKHSHVADAAAYLALAIFGRFTELDAQALWVNQDAYTQAWGGQPAGSRSPSPAGAALARGGFNAENWKRQYRE